MVFHAAMATGPQILVRFINAVVFCLGLCAFSAAAVGSPSGSKTPLQSCRTLPLDLAEPPQEHLLAESFDDAVDVVLATVHLAPPLALPDFTCGGGEAGGGATLLGDCTYGSFSTPKWGAAPFIPADPRLLS